jgi:hypothetical protein
MESVSLKLEVGMHSQKLFSGNYPWGNRGGNSHQHSTEHAKLTTTERDWGYWGGGGWMRTEPKIPKVYVRCDRA